MRTEAVRRAAAAGMILALGLTACGDRERQAEPDTTTVVAATEAPEFASPTLQAVKRRGRLNCGVHEGLVGFAYTDNRGEWRGFDADFCRALAAAVLGRPNAVRFVPLTSSQRFDALRGGRIDVLWRATSWTMSREISEGIRFAGVNYYDGQGFLVRRSLDLASAQELNGARVCVQRETTSELNVGDFFRSRGIEYRPVISANEEAARTAY